MLRRLERFLYTRRNIVGSLLALGGLALHFVGLLGGVLWLPVVIALYAIGVLVTPPERTAAVQVDEVAAADPAEVRAGLDNLLVALRNDVAEDLYAKVVSIRSSILATLGDGSGGDVSDPNVYLIRATALSYLPEAFETYLRLPRAFAERRAVADGRTPHDVLLEQLDLMDRRLADVADSIVRHDSEELLANGRFIAEKFRVSSLRLDDAVAVAQSESSASVPAVSATAESVEAVAERQRERERA